MTTESYRVIFKGTIADGYAVSDVKANLSKLYKNPAKLDSLFTGMPVVIKKNAAEADCRKIRKAFQKAGALCTIQKETDKPSATNAPSPPSPLNPPASPPPPPHAAGTPPKVPPLSGTGPMPLKENEKEALKRLLASDETLCASCGRIIKKDAPDCQFCGTKAAGKFKKSILLAVTLVTGLFGGHKFYLKQYGQGILYMLFFWTFIPALVSLVELFLYMRSEEEELQQRYPEGGDKAAVVVLLCLVVIWAVAAIGIIYDIAIPNFQHYRNRAYIAAIDKELTKVKAAEDKYFADFGKYTNSLASLEIFVTTPDVSIEIVSADNKCFRAKGVHSQSELESWIDCKGTNATLAASSLSKVSLDTAVSQENMPPVEKEISGSEIISEDGAFQVVFPGDPTESTQTLMTPVGPIDIHILLYEEENSACIVGYSDYPDELMEQADFNDLLDDAIKGGMQNMNGELDTAEDILLNGYYGREVVFKIRPSGKLPTGGNGKARYYIAGSRLYQVLMVGNDVLGDERTDAFLNSFSIEGR